MMGPNIPECRGWRRSCGEYVNNYLELCELCELEKHLDEKANEWWEIKVRWQKRQSEGGRQ